jgi:response regulator RpfG family c-di-GMP phosphodiesterase
MARRSQERLFVSENCSPECFIVYIEDDYNDHLLFSRSAQRTKTPFYIQPFFSSEPALAYLRRETPYDDRTEYPPPWIVLCDYDLGSVKGCDIVSALRHLPECKMLPTIIFSGADRPETIFNSYAAGADHFIVKPTSSVRLDLIVQTLYKSATSNPQDFSALRELTEHRVCPAVVPAPFDSALPAWRTNDTDGEYSR